MNITLRRAWEVVSWYIGSIMGDRSYGKYVQHLRAQHPGAQIPTEREYWRARHAEADAKPGMRCC